VSASPGLLQLVEEMRRPQTSNCTILTALHLLYRSGKLGPSQGIQRSLLVLLTWRLPIMTAGEHHPLSPLPSPIFQCGRQVSYRPQGKFRSKQQLLASNTD
jgi:hypothetical protein